MGHSSVILKFSVNKLDIFRLYALPNGLQTEPYNTDTERGLSVMDANISNPKCYSKFYSNFKSE